jgi:hypothetical protein
MNVFIVGLPSSGRTTVSKKLCSELEYEYADATSWAKNTFRVQKEGEHIQQFQDEYHHYLTHRMKINPDIFVNNVYETMQSYPGSNFVIDGVNSPRDLSFLFDYNKDLIVFLNRTDAEPEFKDYENVGLTVMRDYCYWLSSAALLPKERWLEFNFKIPGENLESFKQLGSKNTLFIVKNINKVSSIIVDKVNELTHL